MSEAVLVNGVVYEGQRVPVVSQQQAWSEFLLADGTVIRLCAVLTKALTIPALCEAMGRPIYHWEVGFMHDVSIPAPAKPGGPDAG